MKAQLIKNYNNQVKIYELSEPIYKGKSDLVGEVDIEKSKNDIYERLKKEYVESANKYKKKGCYHIAISMAHTHVECLVFPAIKIAEDRYAWTYDDIGGQHTMMIYGGDPSTIHPDEVYIRRLAQINGLKWEGII